MMERHLFEPIRAGNDSFDTDAWDEGDDNPDNFGPLPGQNIGGKLSTHMEATVQPIDEYTFVEKRQSNFEIVQRHGQGGLTNVLDQVDRTVCGPA